MKFVVTYENEVWNFEVFSTGDEPDYYEEFEILDLDEAKTIAADLAEEIAAASDEDEEE